MPSFRQIIGKLAVLTALVGSSIALPGPPPYRHHPYGGWPPHSSPRDSTASEESWDFIIVGGGAAGLALATRLSEDLSQNVLVLEAGPPPEVVDYYLTPGADQVILGTELDWGFVTAPQPTLFNRTITYNRGRGLGGSTLINGLTYGRGSAGVYNLWNELGNKGWDWDSVLPYFEKSTSFIPVNYSRYQTYEPSAYSPNGPISLSYPSYTYDSSTDFCDALRSVNVSVVKDLNLGNNIGTKQEPLVLNHQFERVSAYNGYYQPVTGRPNLSVRPRAWVQQLLLEQGSSGLRASGVVYRDQVSGVLLNATASKEVVLSAGVFQTPQLLMLSGIGPQETLDKFGISTYLANENIGRHMQDHFYFSVVAHAKEGASASNIYNRVDLTQAANKQYAANHSGPFTTPIGPSYGFRSLSVNELEDLGDDYLLANRTAQAHIEYLLEVTYFPTTPSTVLAQYPRWLNETFLSITSALLAPKSRGSVSLQSNSANEAPLIDVNYLGDSADQRLALYMFKSLRKILAQPEISQHTYGPHHGEVVPGANIDTDEEILKYIKSTLITVWHASGTCRMLPKEDGGVVDDRLKVYGIDGLRVVDASIFPVIPDQHIQGPTYMVAEKAADMIKEDWGLKFD